MTKPEVTKAPENWFSVLIQIRIKLDRRAVIIWYCGIFLVAVALAVVAWWGVGKAYAAQHRATSPAKTDATAGAQSPEAHTPQLPPPVKPPDFDNASSGQKVEPPIPVREVKSDARILVNGRDVVAPGTSDSPELSWDGRRTGLQVVIINVGEKAMHETEIVFVVPMRVSPSLNPSPPAGVVKDDLTGDLHFFFPQGDLSKMVSQTFRVSATVPDNEPGFWLKIGVRSDNGLTDLSRFLYIEPGHDRIEKVTDAR